MLRGIKGIK